MEITGRHILITGANRGVGRAFAKMCAENKAHLHLVVRSEDSNLVDELKSEGAKSVTVWIADLSKRESVNSLLVQLQGTQIDILFNNAGQLIGGLLESQPIDEICEMIQVNVSSLIQLTHGLLPGMLERKRGKVINVSSITAFMDLPANSTYAASKAAVAAFTQSLRVELKGTGVTTLLLVPPGIKTRMYDKVMTAFGSVIELPDKSLSPSQYVKMVREAILHDLEVLKPSGMAGIVLKAAKFAKPVFDFEIGRRFHR
ncbi:SDR family NAD(P)-dependent oxidoreductase [Bdellovibrio sp. HCB290]|uniref:SDR family NAD(P)-dependent oxidoreductase n=1 Tax=Bdellovibrio sp. HCB290 TaxID=3394356 RepID=UPI0039B37C45